MNVITEFPEEGKVSDEIRVRPSGVPALDLNGVAPLDKPRDSVVN